MVLKLFSLKLTMKRAQAGLEAIMVIIVLLVGGLWVMNEISSSSASLSREKSLQSLENLADAVREVQIQGSSAEKQVDIYIPPEVDPENTGTTEANTIVVALRDGSELVVPVDDCLVGSLPNEPGIHTVIVRGGDCASIANNKFDVSPAYVIQRMQAGTEASLPLTIQTIDPAVVTLSATDGIKDLIDFDPTQPALQYRADVNSPAVYETKIIIPPGFATGTYEGYINAETATASDKVAVRIEVYSNEMEVVVFKDSSRTEESNKFNVNQGLFYRVYLRNNGELIEGNLEAELRNPSDVPVTTSKGECESSIFYAPSGIYEGAFTVKDNLCYAVPGTETGMYTLKVTDVESGQIIETQVEGTAADLLSLQPESIIKWVSPDSQIPIPITLETPEPADVQLSLTGSISGLVDLMSSTGDYDNTRDVSTASGPITLNDVYLKVSPSQAIGTYTGTITATMDEIVETIPVSITVYSDDLGWKIEFEGLGITANTYDGTGAESINEGVFPLSSTGWKIHIAENCGKNRGSSSGYCSPTDAWGKCDNEPSAAWNTLGFDDSSWSPIDFPAYSDNYESTGNFLCNQGDSGDCTGFFRKYFTLTQDDIDTITSMTVKFRGDEGVQCFINGQDMGFETGCQTSWLPQLQSKTSTGVVSSLHVGQNVIACRLQERRKYSETYFKYFDAGLDMHKEIPPAEPLAEIAFKVLDQKGDPITGLSVNSHLKKVSGSDAEINEGNPHVESNGNGYKFVFSPSAIGTKPSLGSGVYLVQLDTSYKGSVFRHGVTFNIDQAPDANSQWRIEISNPADVAVDPDNPMDLKVKLLSQTGSSLSGKADKMEMSVKNLDTGSSINCEIRDDGVYYHCEQGGEPLDLASGQYYVQVEYVPEGASKGLYRSFTFNAVST
jgi:hypothetical protein